MLWNFVGEIKTKNDKSFSPIGGARNGEYVVVQPKNAPKRRVKKRMGILVTAQVFTSSSPINNEAA